MAGRCFASGGGAVIEIRRVDDKRMVIHTKARAKVHIKCRQGMKIKRAGSYAVQGISDVNSKKTDNKTVSYRISDNKKLLQGKKPAVLDGSARKECYSILQAAYKAGRQRF